MKKRASPSRRGAQRGVDLVRFGSAELPKRIISARNGPQYLAQARYGAACFKVSQLHRSHRSPDAVQGVVARVDEGEMAQEGPSLVIDRSGVVSTLQSAAAAVIAVDRKPS